MITLDHISRDLKYEHIMGYKCDSLYTAMFALQHPNRFYKIETTSQNFYNKYIREQQNRFGSSELSAISELHYNILRRKKIDIIYNLNFHDKKKKQILFYDQSWYSIINTISISQKKNINLNLTQDGGGKSNESSIMVTQDPLPPSPPPVPQKIEVTPSGHKRPATLQKFEELPQKKRREEEDDSWQNSENKINKYLSDIRNIAVLYIKDDDIKNNISSILDNVINTKTDQTVSYQSKTEVLVSIELSLETILDELYIELKTKNTETETKTKFITQIYINEFITKCIDHLLDSDLQINHLLDSDECITVCKVGGANTVNPVDFDTLLSAVEIVHDFESQKNAKVKAAVQGYKKTISMPESIKSYFDIEYKFLNYVVNKIIPTIVDKISVHCIFNQPSRNYDPTDYDDIYNGFFENKKPLNELVTKLSLVSDDKILNTDLKYMVLDMSVSSTLCKYLTSHLQTIKLLANEFDPSTVDGCLDAESEELQEFSSSKQKKEIIKPPLFTSQLEETFSKGEITLDEHINTIEQSFQKNLTDHEIEYISELQKKTININNAYKLFEVDNEGDPFEFQFLDKCWNTYNQKTEKTDFETYKQYRKELENIIENIPKKIKPKNIQQKLKDLDVILVKGNNENNILSTEFTDILNDLGVTEHKKYLDHADAYSNKMDVVPTTGDIHMDKYMQTLMKSKEHHDKLLEDFVTIFKKVCNVKDDDLNDGLIDDHMFFLLLSTYVTNFKTFDHSLITNTSDGLRSTFKDKTFKVLEFSKPPPTPTKKQLNNLIEQFKNNIKHANELNRCFFKTFCNRNKEVYYERIGIFYYILMKNDNLSKKARASYLNKYQHKPTQYILIEFFQNINSFNATEYHTSLNDCIFIPNYIKKALEEDHSILQFNLNNNGKVNDIITKYTTNPDLENMKTQILENINIITVLLEQIQSTVPIPNQPSSNTNPKPIPAIINHILDRLKSEFINDDALYKDSTKWGEFINYNYDLLYICYGINMNIDNRVNTKILNYNGEIPDNINKYYTNFNYPQQFYSDDELKGLNDEIYNIIPSFSITKCIFEKNNNKFDPVFNFEYNSRLFDNIKKLNNNNFNSISNIVSIMTMTKPVKSPDTNIATLSRLNNEMGDNNYLLLKTLGDYLQVKQVKYYNKKGLGMLLVTKDRNMFTNSLVTGTQCCINIEKKSITDVYRYIINEPNFNNKFLDEVLKECVISADIKNMFSRSNAEEVKKDIKVSKLYSYMLYFDGDIHQPTQGGTIKPKMNVIKEQSMKELLAFNIKKLLLE